MVKLLSTVDNRVGSALRMKDAVSNGNFYLFMSNHVSSQNTEISDVHSDFFDTNVDVYRNMIQGKRISNSDVSVAIRYIPYVSNIKYTMYDDQDTSMALKDFYVTVHEGSFYHTYKCLDNNNDSLSTSQPTFSHITGTNTSIYQTSDGYRWKYMYTITDSQYNKFASSKYLPCFANTQVEANAVQGSLDIIKIDDQGQKYDNYVRGTFKSGDLRINSNTLIYGISNTTASTTNSFYNGCLLYISAGSGAGEIRTIMNYISSVDGNFIVLDTPLTTPMNGSQYEIYPKVLLTHTNQNVNAVARALVNSQNSNSVYRIEFLVRGEGLDYSFVDASVYAHPAVPVLKEAELRVIVSPAKGHGSNTAIELYANTLAFSVSIANSEANTLLTENKFQQFGLLRNPTFDNVYFTVASTNSVFVAGEVLYSFNSTLIVQNAASNTTSPTITATTAEFDTQVEVGQMIYLYDTINGGTQLANVSAVTNSSSIDLTVNCLFESTDIKIYTTNVVGTANIVSVFDSNHFWADNCDPTFITGAHVVGYQSGKSTTINTISRSGVPKTFDTFIQLKKYYGPVSGNFTEDERVIQDSTSSYLFTEVKDGSNSTIYVSNQSGIYSNAESMVGESSGALFTITNAYSGELRYGEASVIYIENIPSVSRSNTETEKFQIFFEF